MKDKIIVKQYNIVEVNYGSQHSKPCKKWMIETSQKDKVLSFGTTRYRETELKEGDKVYFSGWSKFPRYKFRECFPKNSIVRDIKNADVVVMDPGSIRKSLGNLWWSEANYVELKDYSEPTYMTEYYALQKQLNKYPVIRKSFIRDITSDMANSIRIMQEWEGSIVTDDNLMKIINKQGVELTGEMIASIAQLLRADNKKDVQIGINICCTLDFERYGHVLAYLFHQSGKRFGDAYGYSVGTMGNLLAKKLAKNYRVHHDTHELSLLKRISEENDDYTELLLQTYVDKYMGEGNFKITRQ